MGGDPNFGQLGKAMKPLEAEHGPQKVLAHWEVYLANPDTPNRVKNPSHFGQKFGLYSPAASDPATYFSPAEVLAAQGAPDG